MNYQIAQPLDIDHMPAEVATEMLARGRLTNRQRKQCVIARQKVFGGGTVPLVRHFERYEFWIDRAGRRYERIVYPLCFDADFSPPLPEEKLDRRLSRVPIDRLSRLVRRSIRARRRVQTAYLRLAGDESKKAVQLRRLLDLAAVHHEAVQDSAQSIVNARLKRANNPVK